MNTPDVIRERAAALGMSLHELARRAGLPWNTLAQVLSGRRQAALPTLRALATPLGCTIDDLDGARKNS